MYINIKISKTSALHSNIVEMKFYKQNEKSLINI